MSDTCFFLLDFGGARRARCGLTLGHLDINVRAWGVLVGRLGFPDTTPVEIIAAFGVKRILNAQNAGIITVIDIQEALVVQCGLSLAGWDEWAVLKPPTRALIRLGKQKLFPQERGKCPS